MFPDIMIPPGVLLILGAMVLPVIPRHLRSSLFLVFPLAGLLVISALPNGYALSISFLNLTLTPIHVDALSKVFGVVFALICLAGGVYAFHLKDTGQQVAALLYAGSAIGVTFAGDYFTMIVFWEAMALGSTYLVWARKTPEAQTAGMRYLLVHLFGGSLLLGGIIMHASSAGTLGIEQLTDQSSPGAWLILAGVALNAAVPPLNAWLPDAYPKSTVTGSVFLSAFTTKTSVYVLARIFPGWEVLLVLGVVMTLYGVVFAVLSNDIRGILSYHVISQVGFMVAGIGVGTEMAINGSVAHAYSHILYKALLFMGAGMVLQMTGKTKLTELGGLYGSMPAVFWLYLVGAFSISGIPLFNGFISKSMVVAAGGEAGFSWSEKLLHLASVGTFLSITLKLAYGTWFGEKKEIVVQPAPWNMYVGMGTLALLCTLYGVVPSLLYQMLPFVVEYEPYTVPHVVEVVEMVLLAFVAFWLLRSKLEAKAGVLLDTDWFYRRPAGFVAGVVVDGVGSIFDRVEEWGQKGAATLALISRNPLRLFFNEIDKQTMPLEDFNPNAARQPMLVVIGLVLLCFSVIALLGLMR